MQITLSLDWLVLPQIWLVVSYCKAFYFCFRSFKIEAYYFLNSLTDCKAHLRDCKVYFNRLAKHLWFKNFNFPRSLWYYYYFLVLIRYLLLIVPKHVCQNEVKIFQRFLAPFWINYRLSLDHVSFFVLVQAICFNLLIGSFSDLSKLWYLSFLTNNEQSKHLFH